MVVRTRWSLRSCPILEDMLSAMWKWEGMKVHGRHWTGMKHAAETTFGPLVRLVPIGKGNGKSTVTGLLKTLSWLLIVVWQNKSKLFTMASQARVT